MEAPKYDRIPVGKLLQQARKASGLTQEKAAEAAGCSCRHLVQIEGGTTGLSIDLLLSLCSVYQITPNDAFLAILSDEKADIDEISLLSAYRNLSNHKKKTARTLLTALVREEKEEENERVKIEKA